MEPASSTNYFSRTGLATLGALPGVLWIVSDEALTEVGCDPGWMARRCGAKPWWLDLALIQDADVSEATLLLRLRDGLAVSFRANPEGLAAALAKTPLAAAAREPA